MQFDRSVVIVLLALAASAGAGRLAGAGDCRPVHAGTGPSTYNGACTYGGVEYAFCISSRAQGTLEGDYRFYGAADDWVEVTPNDPVTSPPYLVTIPDIKPPGHQGILAGWALEVFHTKHGDLYAHTSYVFPLGLLSANIYGIYGGASVIRGGTGRYAGATGWLGSIQSEAVGTLIRGQICTP